MPLNSTNPAVILRDLLESAQWQLPDSDTARLDCEILLCNVLQQDRHFIYSHPEARIDSHNLADFNTLIAKRAAGFPVAYLTGLKEFWSLQLKVNQYTLIPRPETELLVEMALDLTSVHTTSNILDLGTGSGAIAIAIAMERPGCRITASDISLSALSLAKQNAEKLKLNNLQFVHSDWFTAIRPQHFELIISNPPYIESDDSGFSTADIRHEPRLALDGGRDGLDAYRRIIPAATAFIASGGNLLFEHGHLQGEPIRQLFRSNHYRNIETKQDYAGLDRVTLATLP